MDFQKVSAYWHMCSVLMCHVIKLYKTPVNTSHTYY